MSSKRSKTLNHQREHRRRRGLGVTSATSQVTAAPNVSAYCIVKVAGEIHVAVSVFDATIGLVAIVPPAK